MKDIINQFFHKFEQSSTTYYGSNYFLYDITYCDSDTWTTKEQWIHSAKIVLEQTDDIDALEILLKNNLHEYFPRAEKIIYEWLDNGGYDPEPYEQLLSLFPRNHPCRVDYFYPHNIHHSSIMACANDELFLVYLSEWVDEQLLNNVDDEIIEIEVLPKIADLGKKAQYIISHESQKCLKEFFYRYLSRDKIMYEKILNGDTDLICSEERTLWIADDIAYFIWIFNWHDMMEFLEKSDWYWACLFSEYLDDDNNRQLLALSNFSTNPILFRRCDELIALTYIDGVIAKSRLLKQANKHLLSILSCSPVMKW